MTDHLPILDGLMSAASHAERELWLKQCSFGLIDREHLTIRRALEAANLPAGIAYLEALKAYSSATRLPDGSSRPDVLRTVHVAALVLSSVVEDEQKAKAAV